MEHKEGESKEEFVQTALRNKDEKGTLALGDVGSEAKKKLFDVFGASVDTIFTSMDDIRHAHQEKHSLKPGDFHLAVEVINTATDISLSARKHADSDVLVFKKDIDGEITFLAEIHAKKKYLEVFDCWRKKRSRNRPDAAERPPKANVQSATPSLTNSIAY